MTILFLFMAIAFSGCASNKDKIIEPKTPGEYDYSGKGYLESKITYNGKTKEKNRIDTIYDENGNIMYIYKYSYDKETKDATCLTTISKMFYENNKKTKEVNYTKEDGSLKKESKTEYKYDGDKLSKIINYLVGNKESFYKWWTEEYTYDSKGNMTTLTHEMAKDEEWKGRCNYKNLYTYDDNNNLIEMHSYAKYSKEYVEDELYVYTYDEYNNMTSESFYTGRYSSVWLNEYKNEYKYDDKNRETVMIQYDSKDYETWEMCGKTETSYDTNNNKTSVVKYKGVEPYWNYNGKTEYAYENSRIIEENRYDKDEVLAYKYEYSYKDYN